MEEGAGKLSGSLIRALTPLMRAPPSRPNYLPKAPPPKAITLGISAYELCEDTNLGRPLCEGPP